MTQRAGPESPTSAISSAPGSRAAGARRARPRPRRSPSTTTTSAPSPAIASRRAAQRRARAGRPARAARARAATCATARPWLPALAATSVCDAGSLAQRALDRPRRAEHLERRQPEPVGLVLEQHRARGRARRRARAARAPASARSRRARAWKARGVGRRAAGPRPGRRRGLTSALTRRSAPATPSERARDRLGVRRGSPTPRRRARPRRPGRT